jgi:Fe-S-cluster containining protein
VHGTVLTCASCKACCCRLEVILSGDDDVPLHLVDEDQWGGQSMGRGEDGWCVALDRATLRCSIYERRPRICRDYELGGADCGALRQREGLTAS